MKLQDWLIGWPYSAQYWIGQRCSFLPTTDARFVSVPDSAMNESYRNQAWMLEDFRVSSIRGGSIWFERK